MVNIMSLITRLSVVLLLLSSAIGCAPDVAAKDEPGIAVVELFTSQGCSSCPPADKLLEEIAASAEKSKLDIYCLSFHVDYWNKLGWTDPFSDAGYTNRQREYSQELNLRSIYTPQMIVNGTKQFVGSDRAIAKQAIATALAEKPTVTIELEATAKVKTIAVAYKLSNAPQGAILNVAWTQAEATSNPNRGENNGRKLHNINIVRDFQTVNLDNTKGDATLTRHDVKIGTVIAYVQEANTGRILGASSYNITLPQ